MIEKVLLFVCKHRTTLNPASQCLYLFLNLFLTHSLPPSLQCEQIWQNFATLAKFWNTLANLKGLCYIFHHFVPNLLISDSIGKIYFAVIGQIRKSNVAIWLHCLPFQFYLLIVLFKSLTPLFLSFYYIISWALLHQYLSLSLSPSILVPSFHFSLSFSLSQTILYC